MTRNTAPGPEPCPRPGLTQDKAGAGYWRDVWLREAPEPVDLDDATLRNHINLRLGRFFTRHLPPARPGQILLEAGCGASAWLPVFARRFGYQVMGVDYSEQGCGLAQAVLRKARVPGEILRADLFASPAKLRGRADVVFSQGLVEHFTPTSGVLERLAWLTRPGGLVLTLVPNMRGLTGLLQRLMDKRIYDLHVPLTPAALARAHRACGLMPEAWGHLGTLNLGVINCSRWARTPLAHRALTLALGAPSLAVWQLERLFKAEWPSNLASPLVYCVARKPCEDGL
ncbi:MAG: class I SAM-dependent methyltransferase [Humidesulfovibrio sp.]|nr:class I SAM-dependent methyltransferase [Humidesulfovibrio sp.]